MSLEAFGLHNCGGSIISADTILTAAHCIDGYLDFVSILFSLKSFSRAISVFYEVVSGTSDLLQNGTHSTIKQTIVHEGYDGLGHDAALVIVRLNFGFIKLVRARFV